MRLASVLAAVSSAATAVTLLMGLSLSPGPAVAMPPAGAGALGSAAATMTQATATTQVQTGNADPIQEPQAARAERRLQRHLARRGRALTEISRRAARYDRELQGLREVLVKYGYHGDPSSAQMVLPIANYRMSAGFGLTGPLWESTHGGQDFSAASGEPLVAVAAGTIAEVGDAGPYGLRTILTLEDGTEIWYCHQTSASVLPGDVVEIADEIGTVGSTGNSTGPHLHLEVRPGGGSPVNPAQWFAEAGLAF
jgi:murein DD-endopeptidase MepM/ murein hydrolase activator NlpD